MTNAIKDVLSAEREAEELIAKAQRNQEAEILNAKQKALQVIEQGKARTDAKMDAQLRAQRQQLNGQREKILAQATQEAAALERNAKAKVPRVVERLLKQFEV